MRKSIWLTIRSITAMLALTRCVEPFDLPVSATDAAILVVEGHVDVDNGTGSVRLSRTLRLGDESGPKREERARVTIETEQNEAINLLDRGNGTYFVSGLHLGYGKQYRLRVKTAGGEEYLSEFVSTQKTPEIDSLTWRVQQGGVQISVNSHDPINSTRYYRWEFEETYEYTSYFNSMWVYRDGNVEMRPLEQSIYRCWRSEPSKAILVGTTVQLSQDVVRDFPITFQNGNTEKFSRKYSILVKQYGLSKEEYEYWQMLKKNTENVGSIFDAQPSQVRGNFKNISNPDKPVLGYFSARSMSNKRMSFTAEELLKQDIRYNEITLCYTDTVQLRDLPDRLKGKLIVDELLPPASGFVLSGVSCADCRTKGGTTAKPEYWDE